MNPIQLMLIVIGVVSIGILVIIGCVVTAVSKGVGEGTGLTARAQPGPPPVAGRQPPPVPGRDPRSVAGGRIFSGRAIGTPASVAPPGSVLCAQYGCRAANPASARFCRRCGQPLARAGTPLAGRSAVG